MHVVLLGSAAVRFDDLCTALQALEFPSDGERDHPELRAVLAARSSIQDAVLDDDFLASCLQLELQLIERNDLRPGLVPFFTMPGLGIRFAFGYWSPGGSPGPHEHTAWTITAVCRNQLEVVTYDREESYSRRELVPKNRFPASAGKVGYIYKPSIHAPINNSSRWSLSFHMTSPRDGEDPGDGCGDPLPGLMGKAGLDRTNSDHVYRKVIETRRRVRRLRAIGNMLPSLNSAKASSLSDKCAALGGFMTEMPESGNPTRHGFALERVHTDLELSYRLDAGMAVLCAETPSGSFEELAVDSLGCEAIAFVSKEQKFTIDDMPGNLSPEERLHIADALVETGLYVKIGDDYACASD
ncbi:hypothetical protein [Streptomyces sp. NPDC013187]|uniref:hypothetical protein n=1 Tax=Streptomyces sp. NPDC013187 TaxID=3364865 RepID=UPI0036A2B56C